MTNKLLTSVAASAIFLGAALAPAAYAQDNDNDRGQRAKAERSERASQRGNAREVRAERSGRVERAERAAPRERAQQVERADRQADRSPRVDQSGEQQRAALTRAVVNRPALVLADEPTAHLDAVAAAGLLQLLAQFSRAGVTVLLASHQLPPTDGVRARVIAIADGRISA